MNEKEDSKPPPPKNTIRNFVTSRVHSSSNNGSIARRREVAFLQHLSSPMLKSRLRNDLVILETV